MHSIILGKCVTYQKWKYIDPGCQKICPSQSGSTFVLNTPLWSILFRIALEFFCTGAMSSAADRGENPSAVLKKFQM